MPNETQTAVVAPAAAEPAAVAAPVPAVAAPAVQVERSLADYVADHQAMIAKVAGRAAETPSAKEEPAAVATEAPAKLAGEVPAVVSPAAAEPAKEVPAAKPTEDPKKEDKPAAEDTRAKQLADFVRLQRQNRADAKRLEAEKAALAAERTQVEASKAEVAKFNEEFAKDPVAAVERRLGKSKFSTEFLLSALDRASAAYAEAAPTEEEKQEILVKAAAERARAELKAEQEAAQAKLDAAQEKVNEEGQARYFGQVDGYLRANADKFPNMAAEGWDTSEMVAAVEAHHAASGQWPTAAQVLQHFENLHVQRAETYAKRHGYVKPAAAAPATIASSPAAAPVRAAVDSRGKPDKPMVQGSIAQQRAEIVARLDGVRTGG